MVKPWAVELAKASAFRVAAVLGLKRTARIAGGKSIPSA
jgi:hypothetical protein